MHHNDRSLRQQQSLVRKQASRSSSYRFFDILTSDILLNTVDQLLPEHREREFPPTETLSMFLAQVMSDDRSCQNAVNQAAVNRLEGGLGTISTSTGGYCRARARLPAKLVSSLTTQVAQIASDQAVSHWLWKGRRVKLVDGTTVTMPDTPASQAAFPQQGSQRPGLGFPICRVLAVNCLSTGMVCAAAIGPFKGKGGNERCLLRTLEHTFSGGEIILADAFFPNYFFLAKMQAQGVDILRQQNGSRAKTADFRRGSRLGTKDHLIRVEKPKAQPVWMTPKQYEAAPDSLMVRELRVNGKVLVTTLTDPKSHSKDELKRLYKSRWNVELDIRSIKTTLQMNALSCKSPEMAVKEIWVYLLAYNLIRLMMAQSATIAGVRPRELSFRHCLQLWLSVLTLRVTLEGEQLALLFALMAQKRVGHRAGRVEPRAVKRRPKALPLLTQTREVARAKIREHGHPVRVK